MVPSLATIFSVWDPLGQQTLAGMAPAFQRIYQSVPMMVAGTLILITGLGLSIRQLNWRVRRRIRSRIHRLIRWEFWPIAVLYFPVIIYNFWLLLKYRKMGYLFLSNPGIEYGGVIGESKSKIMGSFQGHEAFFARFTQVNPKLDLEEKVTASLNWMKELGLQFPIVAKPDLGFRGTGVQRIKSQPELRNYLNQNMGVVHLQECISGPYEFGIFYRRYPGQERGKILGLTGKEFPRIVGDGISDVEALILKHPNALGRLHIYRSRFKHRLKEVLPRGKVVSLVNIGNHCLGTIFNDSSHLITEALSEKVETLSRSLPGFYVGRFDIRARDLEAFRLGREFKIIELNGATGEPSHIYDTRHPLFYAYKHLFAHYRDLWEIGYRNYRGGHPLLPTGKFLKALWDYRKKAASYPKPE